MLKAYSGNRVLRIPDEKKNDYIALGYKITDMRGKVLHDPVNNSDSVKDLKKSISEKDKAIEELNAKIAEDATYAEQRNSEFEAMSQKVAELEAAVAEKDKSIAEKDKAIEELNAKIAEGEKAEKKTAGSSKTSK